MILKGEAGERATFNNDQAGELIPASADYEHAGTSFYYWGHNVTNGQPNVQICWDDPEDPLCAPRDQGLDATIAEQHYFCGCSDPRLPLLIPLPIDFVPVGQCGGPQTFNGTAAEMAVEGQAMPSPSVPNGHVVYSSILPATTAQATQGLYSTTWQVVYTTTAYYSPDETSTAYYQDTTFYEPAQPTYTFTEPTYESPEPTRTRATRTRTRATAVPTRYTATTEDGGEGSPAEETTL